MAADKHTTDNELAILKAQVKDLSEKLGVSEGRRQEAEAQTLAVKNSGLFFDDSEEQPTGNTVETQVCINPWVTEEKKQKWETVNLPTFMYTINLPVSGGTHLSTNGFNYYHGETYEVDTNTLADLKSRVARSWEHEKSIHSSTAREFDKYIDTRLKNRAAVARSLPQL